MLGCGDLPYWTHSNATQQSQAQQSQGRVTLRNQQPGPHSHPAQELLLHLPRQQPVYPSSSTGIILPQAGPTCSLARTASHPPPPRLAQ